MKFLRNYIKFKKETVACDCDLNNLKIRFIYKKKPLKEKKYFLKKKYYREIIECKKCNHLFNNHKYKISEIYSKRYFNITYKDNKNLEKRFNFITNLREKYSDNKKRVKRVLSFIKKKFKNKKIKALDIGSGIGVFLFELKKYGINCTGIERDNRYVNFCRKNHDLDILNKDIFKIRKKNFTFNLISCNKVLEHLENPVEFLQSFKKFSKKNTIVYLEVPSNKSLIKGKKALELALEHFHVFSLVSFKNMIKKAGFKVLKISNITDPSGKKTLFAFCK